MNLTSLAALSGASERRARIARAAAVGWTQESEWCAGLAFGLESEMLAIGSVVGLNNFAVALMLGALGQRRRRWRNAGVFAVFEFTVPLIGLLPGSALAETLSDAGRWIGVALLIALGAVAVRSATREVPRDRDERDRVARQVTSWGGLFALAAGLTVDNLIVGFSLGLGDAEPLLLAGTIAFFATFSRWQEPRSGPVAGKGSSRSRESARVCC